MWENSMSIEQQSKSIIFFVLGSSLRIEVSYRLYLVMYLFNFTAYI